MRSSAFVSLALSMLMATQAASELGRMDLTGRSIAHLRKRALSDGVLNGCPQTDVRRDLDGIALL